MKVTYKIFPVFPLLLLLAALPATAQSTTKIGIIDVSRIMTDSERGKTTLAALEKFQAERAERLKGLNDELTELQKRINDGRLSLAEDKLVELREELERKARDFERAREDAERELERRRREDLAKVEREVLPLISAVGQEQGYTAIFQKFDSGLVYADDSIDITDLVIQRFDQAGGAGAGE